MYPLSIRRCAPIILLTVLAALGATGAVADTAGIAPGTTLPTGASITPFAVPGSTYLALDPALPAAPEFRADHPAASALSPDGRTLLVLTSGYNRTFDAEGKDRPEFSSDFVFVFDVSGEVPRQIQAVAVPNAFVGLAFAADGEHFFVAGGVDDCVHVYARDTGLWHEEGASIALGHAAGAGLGPDAHAAPPAAAGLALSPRSQRLVVANLGNDSASVLDWSAHRVDREFDLRPGMHDAAARGKRGGTFPFAIAASDSGSIYIASLRDREVIVATLDPSPAIGKRIHVTGNPTALVLDSERHRLYVAEDNVDRIGIIDTNRNVLVREIRLALGGRTVPARGLSPNALALSPDRSRLFVSLGGANAVAIVGLPDGRSQGFLPTAWYPTSVVADATGGALFVTTAKTPRGSNAGNCERIRDPALASGCTPDRSLHAGNDYVLQKSPGGLTRMPLPDAATLSAMTRLVQENNRIDATETSGTRRLFATLHDRIRHVIYVIKENRTYDQVLGDLPVGNGDPGLAQFPSAVTPNQHALASAFVDLDNFLDSGEVSGTGWPWSVAARTTDFVERTVPPLYARRGFSYDSEGTNRNVNVAIAGAAARRAANPIMQDDEDILPGVSDVAAPDGPDEGQEEQGRLWNEALRRHLRIRNYGFFIDLTRYLPEVSREAAIPLLRDPAREKLVVAYASDPALAPHTDPYFRGFDNQFPDYYRVQEWRREFDEFERRNSLPSLELVRLMHDHLGDFGTAIDGVDTPLTQVADNDYAVGLLVERVAHSRYAKDTLIAIVEDDAQDGPDHVDAHRSIALLVGPFVRHNAVVSTRYTTVDLVRTLELVLGLKPLNIHDAVARPMADVFDLAVTDWTFTATVPAPLRRTRLPLPAQQTASRAEPCALEAHDADYWAAMTAGMDFSSEDRNDAARFNRILWAGLGGGRPYPTQRTGVDLRDGRASLLAGMSSGCATAPWALPAVAAGLSPVR
jgi:DNA-binding beta-propeller fold protein YncE